MSNLMLALRSWSFARVLITSAAWIVVMLLVAAGWVYFQVRGVYDASEGAGIGAVGIGVNTLTLLIVFLLLIAPPVILTLTWLIARRS
jgi:hypothetical protein